MAIRRISRLGSCALAAWVAVWVSGCSTDRTLESLLDDVREELDAPGAILGLELPGQRSIVVATGTANLDTERLMQPSDAY